MSNDNLKQSDVIRSRIKQANGNFFANDNIHEYIKEGEKEQLQKEVEHNFQQLLNSLVIDTDNDHNTKETAKRVAKMFMNEVFKGRYDPMPTMTTFPNAKKLGEMYVLGPIDVRSACSHHFVPIIGECYVGIIPSDTVVGISKVTRLVDWVMSRPHIQEEAAVILADELEKLMQPKGLAIVIKAKHLCMTWRGVKQNGTFMTNSVMRGDFMDDAATRAEFFSIVDSHSN